MRPLRTLPSSLCKAYISSCDLNDNDLMSDNWHRVSNDLSSAEQSGDNLIQQNAPTMLSSSPSSHEGAVHRKWVESTEKVVFSIFQCERLFRTTNLTISCPLPGV